MSNAWQGQSSVQDKLCSKQTQPLLQTDLICMCIRGPAKSQMTFDLQTILVQDQTFHLSNHYNFKYDPTPRLLGIILDEKIKFDNHIMHV